MLQRRRNSQTKNYNYVQLMFDKGIEFVDSSLLEEKELVEEQKKEDNQLGMLSLDNWLVAPPPLLVLLLSCLLTVSDSLKILSVSCLVED